MSNLKNKIQKKISARTVTNKTEQPSVTTISNVPRFPIVSIIIPMYNAEKYIRSCIKSVLTQTFQAFEVICVDDCSTDNTVNILTEAVQSDPRVRIIRRNKNSGGASEPRNMGMRLSRGKYIAFIDSDDMYTKTALQEIIGVAEQFQADVLHTEQVYFPENDVIDITNETKLKLFSKEPELCKEASLETVNLAERVQKFYRGRFFGWVHGGKLYRRDFLLEKGIFFDRLMTSEDIVFYFKVICTAPRVVRVPNVVYIYRHNPNSITRRVAPIEDATSFLTTLMIEGTKVLDDFMSEIPFFVQNPQFRWLPLDYLIQQHLIWTQRFYEKCNNIPLIDIAVRKMLKKYCGEFTPFFAYMYTTVHIYRMRLTKHEKEAAQEGKTKGSIESSK